VSFWSRSGWLQVDRGEREQRLVMDFPLEQPIPVADTDPLRLAALAALGLGEYRDSVLTLRARDLIFVLPDPELVSTAAPDFTALGRLPRL
jgi:hypothetical protein